MAITHLVMHYSATFYDQDIGVSEIRRWHLARGFSDTGYHYVIRLSGALEIGRSPETRQGAHVRGHNRDTIGVCVVGGLLRSSGPTRGLDTRNTAQIQAQIELINKLLSRHPGAEVVGHRDLTATQCPGYDAAAWWASVNQRPAPAPNPVVSAPAWSFDYLRQGDRGPLVRAVQTALMARGERLPRWGADGVFGAETDKALRGFQRVAMIGVDGIVGPVTWAAIFSAGG